MALSTGTHGLRELALFAGVGGGILGGNLLGWRTVCAVEKEPYCREVLLRRQRDGLLPMFPIWDDIRTFDGNPWVGAVDIVSAGFPCQPFSVAGKRQGESDERNMWPETIRVIREVRPRYAFLENVPGLLSSGYFGRILGDLAESGYDARWCVLSAAEVGAPHKRDRLWILATDSDSAGRWIQQVAWEKFKDSSNIDHDGSEKSLADSDGTGCREQRREESIQSQHNPTKCVGEIFPDSTSSRNGGLSERSRPEGERETDVDGHCQTLSDAYCELSHGKWPQGRGRREPSDFNWWESEPDFCRVANGIPHRVDRIKALGNAQVPQCAARAFQLLSGEL